MNREKNIKFLNGRWLVDVSFMQSDGRLKRVRAHFPTKAEAQNHLALVRSQKAMRRLGFDMPEVKKSDRTFRSSRKTTSRSIRSVVRRRDALIRRA